MPSKIQIAVQKTRSNCNEVFLRFWFRPREYDAQLEEVTSSLESSAASWPMATNLTKERAINKY